MMGGWWWITVANGFLIDARAEDPAGGDAGEIRVCRGFLLECLIEKIGFKVNSPALIFSSISLWSENLADAKTPAASNAAIWNR